MPFLEKMHLVFHKSGIFHEKERLLLLVFFLISPPPPLDFFPAKPGDVLSPGGRAGGRNPKHTPKLTKLCPVVSFSFSVDNSEEKWVKFLPAIMMLMLGSLYCAWI